MHKKLLVFVFAFFILAGIAFAEEANITEEPFQVTVTPVKDVIDFAEQARFKITIANPRDTIETFSIRPGAPYVEWFIKTDPISDSSVKGYPMMKTDVYVVIKPISVGIGRYSIRLYIKSESTKEVFKKDIIVNVASMSNLPAVSISGDVPKVIDPREKFTIKVWLENRNAKQLDNLKVELRSTAIHESTTTSLGPLGEVGQDKKTLEFSIQLDKKTPPIKDSLRIIVTATEDEEIYELKSAPFDYEVIKYGEIIDNHNPKFRLFGRYDEISFLNNANVKFTGVAKIESPFYRALFTKATPKAESFVEDGKRYIGWNVSLGAQEEFPVVISINYIPLVVFLIALFIILYLYFNYRSPIVIRKIIRETIRQEGGIIQFVVLLNIKNRSKKIVNNISVIDIIPDIADFIRHDQPGVLQPSKVVHTRKGVVVRWLIDNLDKEEEMVIKYGARSRLSILGTLPLPLARTKITEQDGKVKRSYSNRVAIKS